MAFVATQYTSIFVYLKANSPPKPVMLHKYLQHELTKLQFHSILSSSFNQEALISFSCFLPVPQLCKFAQNLASICGGTHTREQAFASLKEIKFPFSSHRRALKDFMRISISKMVTNVNYLRSKYMCYFHINKVNLGYFCCNV
jgi:hypothetical protein